MYDMFLAHPGCLLRLHFDKSLTKRMEAFMKGNMVSLNMLSLCQSVCRTVLSSTPSKHMMI